VLRLAFTTLFLVGAATNFQQTDPIPTFKQVEEDFVILSCEAKDTTVTSDGDVLADMISKGAKLGSPNSCSNELSALTSSSVRPRLNLLPRTKAVTGAVIDPCTFSHFSHLPNI
jgi:hypothetical protein